ncbi:uncharacterized protein BDZ99DRAFT_507000, partial [Mytilinidion resinicola]
MGFAFDLWWRRDEALGDKAGESEKVTGIGAGPCEALKSTVTSLTGRLQPSTHTFHSSLCCYCPSLFSLCTFLAFAATSSLSFSLKNEHLSIPLHHRSPLRFPVKRACAPHSPACDASFTSLDPSDSSKSVSHRTSTMSHSTTDLSPPVEPSNPTMSPFASS